MNEKLVVIISASAIFNLTLIAIVSWIKSVNRPSYFWLGCMFFAASMAILDNICIFTGNGSIILYHAAMLLNLPWGAYLILLTGCLHSPEKKSIRINWILFAPSLLYLSFILLCLLKPYWAYNTISFAQQGKMTLIGILCNLTICLYSILTNAFLLWKEYVRKMKDNKILELLRVMLLLQILAFAPFIFRFNLEYIILYMPVFGQAFFLYIFFKLAHTTHLFQQNEGTYRLEYEKTAKYAAIRINEEKAEEICIRIKKHMETEKPYLKMEYTLPEMAKELNLLPGTLSMILNSKLNSSFPDYINSLRIKTAIELLNDFYSKNLTIETLAYESGFNNRTSFYNAFKKQTGKRPSDFLKNRLELKKVVS